MMKKLFLFLCVVACGLMSCEGPEGPQGPKGDPGSDDVWIDFITLRENQWKKVVNKDNPKEFYFTYTFVPEVYNGWSDDNVYYVLDEGIIKGDIIFDYKTGNDAQWDLPYIYNWSNKNSQTQIVVFSLEYTVDNMTIYASPSGVDYEDYWPEDNLTFRIYMRW